MEPIRAFWFLSNNFGDALTPWIIRKITDQLPIWVDITNPTHKYVITGSILNWCDKHCTAWGPGIAEAGDLINPETKILASRGPISRDAAIKCKVECKHFGDPALILPFLYKPKDDKKYTLGIIPHYVDQHCVYDTYKGHAHIINITAPVEEVIEEINSCRYVISSSLHGIIAADAYGIPAMWMRSSSGKISGDNTKYKDYFGSVNVEVYRPINYFDWISDDMLKPFATWQKPVINYDFLKTCPFDLSHEKIPTN